MSDCRSCGEPIEWVIPNPKPLKRGPKPKKPLPRSKGFIKRGSRPARVRRTPRGQEQEFLNRLFSKVIRLRDPFCKIRNDHPGGCYSKGYHVGARSTDAAHLWAKSTHPTIRWDLRNAVGACRACHDFMERHRSRWIAWRDTVIPFSIEEPLIAASRGPSPDREKVRAELTAALKALKP